MANSSATEEKLMSFCIVGAGSIGGLMGTFLGHAGYPVTFVDVEGPHLEAMQASGGMRLITPEGKEIFGKARAFAKMEDVGKVDCVVLALKANTLPLIVGSLPSLLHEKTMVVTIQNGIPFWYFLKHGGEHANKPVRAVDPQGTLISSIDADRLIGCIAYPAAHIHEPGVIQHVEGNRFPVGELDGADSTRLSALAHAFNKSGLKSPKLVGDIKDPKGLRAETWLKLWGNLCFNPISALTHSTLECIATDMATKKLASTSMEEAQAVANELGITFRTSIMKRIEGAAKVGKHKTSMLQDVEGGRLTEIDSMVGSVCELGELVGVPTPSIYALYACMRLVNTKIKDEKARVVSFAGDEYHLQPFKKEGSLVPLLDICMVVRTADRMGLLHEVSAVVDRNDGNIGICKTMIDEVGTAHLLLTYEAPTNQVQLITKDLRSRGFQVEVSECDSDYRNDLPFSLPSGSQALPLSEFAQIMYQKSAFQVSGICADRPGVLKTLAGLLKEHELSIDYVETHQKTVPVTEDKTVTAFVFEARVHCTKDIDMKVLEEQFKSASRVLGGTLEFTDVHTSSAFVSPSKQISPVAVQSKL